MLSLFLLWLGASAAWAVGPGGTDSAVVPAPAGLELPGADTIPDPPDEVVDPAGTRLFIGPTARTMEEGKGFAGALQLTIAFAAWAPSDRVTVTGGSSLAGFGGLGRSVWVAPKVQLHRGEEVQIAVGGLGLLTLENGKSAGVVFGVATRGDPGQALHVGVGTGWMEGRAERTPAIMVAGELSRHEGIKWISENYLVPDGNVLVSGGLRVFERRYSMDVGILVPVVDGEVSVYPMVGIAWHW